MTRKGIRRHRYEALAAVGVSFDHFQTIGQGARNGLKETDTSAAVCAKGKLRPVVEAPAIALVDDAVGVTFHGQHIAKGRETRCCHGFDKDRGSLAFHDQTGRPKSRKRLTPPSGWMLNRIWVTGSRRAISST